MKHHKIEMKNETEKIKNFQKAVKWAMKIYKFLANNLKDDSIELEI